jgi:VIT1/CCC1 family predicted Fe2+/Mn2+ transporter
MLGGIVPLLAGILAPRETLIPMIAAVSLILLAALGAIAARAGGAPVLRGALRVLIWGAIAMSATSIVGAQFGALT